MLTITLLLIASYLLGALPFGLWVAWKLKGVDIRMVGSGNIGSTNVGRICGPVAGAAVLVLDALKGLVPPRVGMLLNLEPRWYVLASLLAIVGHNFSVFLKFKGGKGISTSVGAMLGICPKVCLVASLLFGVEILTFRFVSVGSLIGAITLPIGMYIVYPGDHARLGFGIIACVMAFYKHRSNIRRLLDGTEPRVSLRRSKNSAAQQAAPPVQPEIPDPDRSPSNAG
jgi:glycerol-3-phosphate acyltransferase PlsY